MESINHFKISAILSPAAVAALFGTQDLLSFGVLAVYGLSIGVLIDLDHFLWARYNHGHWDHLKDALRAPKTAMEENAEIMDGALGEAQRYTSHFVILVLGTGLAYFAGPKLAALTLIMLSSHILSDVYASYREGVIQV